jgi:protein O-GlcNAc transferase
VIISFSLWGDCKLYNYGALENALLSPEVYPGWECKFYMGRGVIPEVRERLVAMRHVSIVDVDEENKFSNTLWRFRPAFETDETVIVRDCDSRINERERLAVDEWLASDKDFHIMRDHPKGHWGRVLCGMWGARNGILRRFLAAFAEYSARKTNRYFHDMDLLSKEVYPQVVDSSMIHDEHFRYEAHARPFPESDYGGFVGEVIRDCSRASDLLGDGEKVFQKRRCQVP